MHGKRVYFDTAPIVYALENVPHFASVSIPFLRASEDRKLIGFTGAVTLAEMLVKPLRGKNTEYVEVLKTLFASGDIFECVEHSRDSYITAAGLRAEHRYKFVDALHLASAQLLGCQFFVTNDHKFKSTSMIEVICVEDYIDPAPSTAAN